MPKMVIEVPEEFTGICHKHTTLYDIRQSALDFRRNARCRSNSKLSFAFGE